MTNHNYTFTETQRYKIIELSCRLMETMELFQREQQAVDLLVLEMGARDFLTDALAANLLMVERHTDTVTHPASVEKHLDQIGDFIKQSVIRKYKDPEFVKMLANSTIEEVPNVP